MDDVLLQKPQHSVFISHAAENQPFVESTLLPLLDESGVTAWYSGHDLAPGDYWEQGLRDGIRAADWFLLVMSRAAQGSDWVKDELRLALNEGKRILPLRLEDCDPDEFSLRLDRIQQLDFEHDPQVADKLVAALAGWRPNQ